MTTFGKSLICALFFGAAASGASNGDQFVFNQADADEALGHLDITHRLYARHS